MTMDRSSRVFVAGHRGLVGSAIERVLRSRGFDNLLVRPRAELDLEDAAAVQAFYERERPEYVVVAAAKVGGIHANNAQPADFLFRNLQIQNNLIHGAYVAKVRKLLFLGSSCVYPKHAPQPMPEEALLTGVLEPTSEWYSIAKIAGLKLCQAYQRQHGCRFISAVPANAYGPNDNYDLEHSHVLPALIRKFHEARLRGDPSVTCWGSGAPLREFLYADDLAEGCLHLLQHYEGEGFLNLGSGQATSIKELSETVARTVGFAGQIVWDTTKPDGTPRKLLDSSRMLATGWRPRVTLAEGIQRAYEDYQRRFPG